MAQLKAEFTLVPVLRVTMKPLNLILLPTLLLLAASPTARSDGFRTFGYDTPSYIDFELTSYSVAENASTFSITLIRQGDFRRYSNVDFATSEDTASAGDDFKPAGGTIVFGPGETRKFIQITVLTDDLAEESESFNLELSNPDPNSIVFQTSVPISIEDVPPAPATPRLDITVASAARIQLAWDQTDTTYQLERCTTACEGAWEPVPDQPELVEGRFNVLQSVDGPHYFYRLRTK